MRTFLFLASLAGLVACASATAGSATHKASSGNTKNKPVPASASEAPSPAADSLVIVSDRDYVAPIGPSSAATTTPTSSPIPPPRVPNTAIPSETWATSSDMLRASYEVWAKRAGYRVIWHSGDRALPAPVQATGSFSDATEQLLKLFHHVKNPATGQYYPSIYADIYLKQHLVILTENN